MEDTVASARILKNSIFILLSRSMQVASSFFVVVVIARYLTVDQYGQYSYILALVSSVMALSYFGIQQVLIREIAQNRASAAETLGAAIELRTLLSAVAVLTLVVSIYLTELKGVLLAAAFIAIVSEFFLSLSMLSKSVFQAFEKMVYEPFIMLLHSLVLAAGIGCAIFFDLGFVWIFIAAAAANLTQLTAAGSILSRRFIKPVFKIDRSVFRKFLKDALIIGVGIFFYQNLFRINVLTLKWFANIEDVSYFQAPHSLVMQLQVVPTSIAMAVFPVFSRLYQSDRERMFLLYEKTFKFMMIGSLLCGMVFSIFSREIITLVFGSKYEQSVSALMVVAWAMIPLTMDMLLNMVMIAMNQQKYSVMYAGITLLLNLLLSALFVPAHGYMAAAYISVFSYTVLFLFSWYFVTRNGLSVLASASFMKMLVTALVTVSVMLILKPVSLLAAAFGGVAVFTGLVMFSGLLTPGEILFIKGMVRTLPKPDRRSE